MAGVNRWYNKPVLWARSYRVISAGGAPIVNGISQPRQGIRIMSRVTMMLNV
jgi:hypothetical protein